MSKAIICICEGEHDSAFLFRLLRSFDYDACDAPLQNLVSPLKTILEHQMKKLISENIIEEKELSEKLPTIRHIRLFFPRILKNKNGDFVIIITAGSLTKVKETFKNSVINYLEPIKNPYAKEKVIDKCGFFIMLDADENLENQEKYLKNEIKDYITESANLKHNEILSVNINVDSEFGKLNYSSELGLYVVNEESKVTIENIILPLMKKYNSTTLTDVESFVSKYKTSVTTIPEKAKNNKAIIGVAGQLIDKKEGKSNAVFYKNGIYLDKTDIKRDKNCTEIFILIEKLFTKI